MYFGKYFGHGISKRVFATENVNAVKQEENQETYESCPEMVFKNPKDYVKRKLRMLRDDMWIEPSKEEIDHLYSLKTRGDIDRAVHSLIDRYWDNI